jgi:hypothetical protein
MQQLIQARDRQDHLAVVMAAEGFFSSPLRYTKDDRETTVRGLYNKAFVSWFLSLDGKLDDQARMHIDLYRNLSRGASVPGSGS